VSESPSATPHTDRIVDKIHRTESWQIAMRMAKFLGKGQEDVPNIALALTRACQHYASTGYVPQSEFDALPDYAQAGQVTPRSRS
jgi:hypothetical protein